MLIDIFCKDRVSRFNKNQAKIGIVIQNVLPKKPMSQIN